MAVLCKHADVLFSLLLFSNGSSCTQARAEGFPPPAWRQLVIINAKTGIFKRVICRISKRQNNNCRFGRKCAFKAKEWRPTQSAKESRGHLGSEERSPRWPRRCWTSTISHPSVVTAPSWGQNKSMSVEKARSWHALLLGWTVYRWHGVKRGPSCSTLPSMLSRWEVLSWPLQRPGAPSSPEWDHHLPLHTLSVSATRKSYLGSCQVS